MRAPYRARGKPSPQHHEAVHVRGLQIAPADGHVLPLHFLLHEHIQRRAHPGIEGALGDRDLPGLELRLAPRRRGFRHFSAHRISGRVLFPRVGERAHPVQARLVLEIEELREILLSLPGETEEESGADGSQRQARAYLRHESQVAVRLSPSAHGAQNPRRGMLEGEVEIGEKPRIRGNNVEQSPGKMIGMDVEEPDPEIALQGGDVGKQRDKRGPGAVFPVGAEILRNEDELLYPPVPQTAYLRQDLAPVPACKLAPNERYGAVGAAVRAAFGDLHVCAAGEG